LLGLSAHDRVSKALRRDASHRIGDAVQREHAAEDFGIAVQPALPEAVAQDDEMRPVLLADRERSSERRRRSQRREVLRSNGQRPNALGARAEVNVRAGDVVIHKGGRGLERRHMIAIALEVERAQKRSLAGLVVRVDANELLGLGVRQRFEQYGIDDAEHGGRATDAQGERRDRQQREPGSPDDRSQRPPEIRDRLFEPSRAAGIADVFFVALDIPERRAPRHVHVKAHLLGHLAFFLAAKQERVEALAEIGPHAHASTQFTAVDARSHSARSASSCRRPAGVIS
jgi:hypothetical protein